jgi:Holliday junction resolvase RusA-like endonuclease
MITFFVPGIPRPGGSKRGFVNKKTGRIIITEDCKKSKDWRISVAWAAKEKIPTPFPGPLQVNFEFALMRPKGHFGTGERRYVLKKSAPAYPAVRPDCSKLVRSTEDALKGIAWFDDSQIVNQGVTKSYGVPGCKITIVQLAPCWG